MRDINKVFIHCSDSDYSHHDNIETIRKWHVEERGWSDVGYHYFIRNDGTIENGRPIDKIPAAQSGHNTGSIAICLSGKDVFTEKQFTALRELCRQLNNKYKVTFHGHCEVSSKTCPNFEYRSVLNLDLDGNMPIVMFKVEGELSFWQKLLKWLNLC